jgi:hypothetical protein
MGGGVSAAGRFLELGEDLEALKREVLEAQGAAAPLPITLVSLMQQREFDLMGVPDLAARVEAAGLRVKHHPVRLLCVTMSLGGTYSASAITASTYVSRASLEVRKSPSLHL